MRLSSFEAFHSNISFQQTRFGSSFALICAFTVYLLRFGVHEGIPGLTVFVCSVPQALLAMNIT